MTLKEFLATGAAKPADLARDVGCHRSYITRAAQADTLSLGAAVKIWRARAVKIGPLSGLADHEVEVLARFSGEAA
jgi:hypothetical protein